ncbi:hypothetical protein ACFL4G_06955 [Thermodesulfobacteriota bacterium]
MRGMKIIGLALGVILLIGTASSAMAATVVADFDALPLAANYICCNVPFNSNGVTGTTAAFQWSNLVWTTDGFAQVDNNLYSGGSLQDLWINNINVEFDWDAALTSILLLYGEYGGNINVEVNGDFHNVQNFADLPPVIGGAAVTVIDFGIPGNGTGELRLTGTINSFSIGGQELWIDYVTGETQQCFISEVMK